MRIVKGIKKEQISKILDWSINFIDLMDEDYFRWYILENSDLDKSFVLLDDEDKVQGGYLLGNNQIHNYIADSSKFNGLQGVEGVVLFIEKEFRGKGWGDKLKDAPKELGVDYIWGQQFKDLNNLNDWLKRRELIDEQNNVYITAEIL